MPSINSTMQIDHDMTSVNPSPTKTVNKSNNKTSTSTATTIPLGKTFQTVKSTDKYIYGKPYPMPLDTDHGKPQYGYSDGCIGTFLSGNRCTGTVLHPYVPYCNYCMQNGDPSISIVNHERFGKALVANRELPKGYRMALWGSCMSDDDMPEDDREWGFETADGWFVNPCNYPSSQPQFCQCPGPHEKITVVFASPHLMMEDVDGKKKAEEKYASMLFVTNQVVPKNHQLVMMYAENEKATEGFFKERGIERCDVYTNDFPTILKKGYGVNSLKLFPKQGKDATRLKKEGKISTSGSGSGTTGTKAKSGMKSSSSTTKATTTNNNKSSSTVTQLKNNKNKRSSDQGAAKRKSDLKMVIKPDAKASKSTNGKGATVMGKASSMTKTTSVSMAKSVKKK